MSIGKEIIGVITTCLFYHFSINLTTFSYLLFILSCLIQWVTFRRNSQESLIDYLGFGCVKQYRSILR